VETDSFVVKGKVLKASQSASENCCELFKRDDLSAQVEPKNFRHRFLRLKKLVPSGKS
jgi:hypothetical protein